MVSLKDYAPFTDAELLDKINTLAARLKGAVVQHINSTVVGGGVAEILHSLVPVMNSIGLKARWDVIKAGKDFFEVTKAFHNAFHGVKTEITERMLEIYKYTSRANLEVVADEADFVIIHDQQPLGLVERRLGHRGKWLWYCHIDPVDVDPRLWDFLKAYAGQCDAAIYHLPEYGKDLGNKQFFLPPAINPLSDKNREVSGEEQQQILKKLGISADERVILQVSRFDRLKNPFGLMEAYLKVEKEFPCSLILAGGAADDDPEGQEVLDELVQKAGCHPRVKILNLPPDSHLEINVLQRRADVVVQNSLREGFGLTVTEALWKARPVVATPVGGIRKQVIHEQTGLLAADTDELVVCLKRLLQDCNLFMRLGRQGKEHVRQNFITPVYLYNWLVVLNELLQKS